MNKDKSKDKVTVPVHQAAAKLGMSDQSLREYMKLERIDIGEVLPAIKGKRKRYIISRYKLDEYTGKTKAIMNIGEAGLKAMNQ